MNTKNFGGLVRIATTTLALALTLSAAIAQEMGPPPPGMGGGPGRGPGGPGHGMRGGLMPLAFLAARPDVAQELNLSQTQLEQIRSTLEAARPSGPPPQGQRPDPSEREARMKVLDAQVKGVLTAAQAKRLREIQIGLAGLGAAFDAEVQQAIGVTTEQKAQLEALKPKRGGPGGPGQGGPGGPPPEGGPGGRGGGRGDGRREAMDAKIAAILTDAQEAKLKALAGAPFQPQRF